jgi:serine/threonine protein kinase/tetratricopeptide (TPR) repeat protein
MTDQMERLKAALAERYVVERELGHGGMAVVLLARDLRLDRPIALKVLRPELAAALGAERFLREIEIAAKLTHPNILTLYDCGEAGGLLYYTMPYVEGESLRDRLRRETQLAIEDALGIAREVADALGYAHSLGVVHRDVKPENVLFQAGHAMVADFGIARAVSVAGGERLTETGLAIGTPAYMSPEQAAGVSDVDGRADIYSLGCMLYEMLAGDPPFTGSTAHAILARKSIEQVPPISTVRETVPRHVGDAIAIALARVPADRFATAGEFAAALTPRSGVTPDGAQRSTIAVLPFANMSADPENEYFSDGITEEIINAVAGIPDLRVTARTSAFQFKGKEYDIREIGRKLDVGTVLEGSVRKAGNTVRVTAQLIDVAGGYHLWSERFDRNLEDVFAIQDEIAVAIAGRLSRELAPAARRPVVDAPPPAGRPDPAAYDAYLRGRYHRRLMFGRGDAIAKTAASYREAIERDPMFALAHSALAELHVVLAIGFATQPSRELMPTAKQAAERALSLNPNLAEAQLARALVAMYYEWDYSAAKTGIDRAIALSPSFVDAHFWAEFYHTYVERDFEQAVAANRRAAELDPLDLNVSSRLAQVLLLFGHLDEAVERLERILELDPDFMVAHFELADAYARRGDAARAAAAAERAMQLSGRAVAAVGVSIAVLAMSGEVVRARELLRELTERAQEGYVVPFWLAVAHAGLGEMDRAFEYIDEAQRDRDPNLLYLSCVPRQIGLQADPRYEHALREIGLGHLVERA